MTGLIKLQLKRKVWKNCIADHQCKEFSVCHFVSNLRPTPLRLLFFFSQGKSVIAQSAYSEKLSEAERDRFASPSYVFT
jgi:hypothetical protein